MTNKKRLLPAFWILGCLLFLALARDFLANGRPLYCRIGGEAFWPGLRSVWRSPDVPYRHPLLDSIRVNSLWRTFPFEAAVFAPIPFSPGEIVKHPPLELGRPGAMHPGLPGRYRHWLGTDDRGRDVAAGLISGARIAVLTGVTAMAMAMGIGILLGALAGFWGDDRLKIRRGVLFAALGGGAVAWFYAFLTKQHIPEGAEGYMSWPGKSFLFVFILLLFAGSGLILSRISFLSKKITIPADLLIMRFAEVFNSIPRLIFVFVVAALLPRENQSIWLLIALIGAMSWTGVARFVRADLLRVRELDYVTAARGLGFSEWRILLRHALPNALRSTMIAFAFGVAGAVLLEASLSFLGFGSDTFSASWGSLLNSARAYPQAWWVSVPPGLAICMTILALNAIGEALSESRRS